MRFDRYWPEMTAAIAFVSANRTWFTLMVAGDIIQALVLYFLWDAAYAHAPQFGGMDRGQMVTYLFVAQACRIITAYNMEGQFANYIRSGDVIRDLIVPQTYLWKRLFLTVGWLTTIGGSTSLPLLLAGVLFFGVALPPLAAVWALALSLLLAMVISYGLSSVTASLAFWTDGSLWGVSLAKRLIISFASGALVPLTLFPAWLRAVAGALPFQAGVHIPTAIYLGQLQGGALWQALGVQALWAAGLLAAAHWFFQYSLRKVTIPGG